MKTKDLTDQSVQRNSAKAENANALACVDIEARTEIQPTPIEAFWEMLGAQQALTGASTVLNLLWVENVARLKASKEYKQHGWTWEMVCRRFGMSVDTVDRAIENFREFGKTFFTVNSIARISREAYRAIEPVETLDGKIRIGEEAFDLTKANRDAIEAAIQGQIAKLKLKSEQVIEAKGELEKARKERDNAKNAAKNLDAALTEARAKEANRYKSATPYEKLLIEADEAMRYATGRVVRVLNDKESMPAEKELARAFAFQAVKAFYTSCGITDQDLFFADAIPAGRSPLNEHLAEQPMVRTAVEIAKGMRKQ